MEKVRLIGITKPVSEDTKDMSVGEYIAYCARVSNPANQNNSLTASKLLKYCMNNKHWSVFEMVSLTLEINTTRDIGRQILRHRSFSFQEFSQRYADVSALGFHMREPRYQDKKNRQNSTEFQIGDENDEALRVEWYNKLNKVLDASGDAYRWAIENNIAKEQARVFLPEGLTETRMYMAGTLRSWIHYCQLRGDKLIDERDGKVIKGTQKEHKEIALECWSVITQAIPELKEVLGEE